MVEPAQGPDHQICGYALYGIDAFEELSTPRSRAVLIRLMRGLLGYTQEVLLRVPIQVAHPEGHHSARTRDTE